MKKDKETQKTTDEIVLAHKRRTALVLYLAILFVAALIFVIVSMVSQNQKLKDSSASALDKAVALQDNVRDLKQQVRTLTKEKQELANENQALTEEIANYTAQIESLETLQTQFEDLQAEYEAASQQLEEKNLASDLLIRAQNALTEENEEAFLAAMQELAGHTSQLSEAQTALYEALTAALPEQEPKN